MNRVARKKTIICLLAFILAFSLMPTTTFAATGVTENTGTPTVVNMSQVTGNVEIKADGLHIGTEVVPANATGYEFIGDNSATGYTIKVDSGVTTTVIFNNLTMKTAQGTTTAVTLFDCSHSDTTIVLKGNNVFRNEVETEQMIAYNGCIVKNGADGKLTIKCENSDNPSHMCNSQCGKLDVSGVLQHTTIIGNSFTLAGGTNDEAVFSNLYIEGGNINAIASPHMPGIGAACCWSQTTSGKLTNLNITGGIVNATGGDCCAAIGTGSHGVPIDGIYINGGAKVTARGGSKSPGIGTGGEKVPIRQDTPGVVDYSVKNLVISGGETVVTAFGDQNPGGAKVPGIGCGDTSAYTTFTPPSRLTNVMASPEESYQGYVKYGTSDTSYNFSDDTPFPSDNEFGKFLQAEADNGVAVFYTQVYFGPYKEHNAKGSTAEIGANDVVMKTGGDELSEDDIKKYSRVEGHGPDGNAIPLADFTPDPEQLKKINEEKKAGRVGDFPLTYTYTYTDPDTGEEKTLTVDTIVSLRDDGNDITPDEPAPAIAGNDAIHMTGGEPFTFEELLNLCDVKATNGHGINTVKRDENGNIISKDGVDVDPDQMNALNDAKTNGEVGKYPLTFTYDDPVSGKRVTTTVDVYLRDLGTNDTDQGDPENGANRKVRKADGQTFTNDEINTLLEPVAKDSSGSTIPTDKLTLNPDDVAAVNAARQAGKEGTFPIRYTYTDVDGTTIEFKGEIILYSDPPTITANDAIVHADVAKGFNSKEDMADYLNPVVTDVNANNPKPTAVDVSDEDWAKIQAGTPGDYPVTYTYTYTYIDENGVTHTDGVKTVTVTLTVVDTPVVDANDATITSFEAANNIESAEDLADYLNPSVVDENGNEAEPTEVVVSPEDLEAIKAGEEGTYEVTYKYTYTDTTGPEPVERTVEKTVTLTITKARQDFSGTKTLTENGQPKEFADGDFTFTITAGPNNPAAVDGLPAEAVPATADGKIDFGTVVFVKEGTYTFTVSEMDGGAAGYNYDSKDVTVTVNVSINQETGKLEIANISYNKGGEQASGISFENTYTTPDPVTMEFGGTKTLTENGEDKAIAEGQFKVAVTEAEDNPAEIIGLPADEVEISADGTFALGILDFTEAGTYTFTISEVNGRAMGYSYDDKAVKVTVTVVLNVQTNVLEIENVVYEKAGEETEEISFANTYTTPTGASQVFGGTKTLTENGTEKAITPGQFKFTAEEEKDNPAKIIGLPEGEMLVGADGTFALGTLNFTKVGTYKFTVSEVNDGAAGYTYDDKVVTVTVTVELNTKTNELEVKSVTYEKAGKQADGIAFVNTYATPDAAVQTFVGTKTLTEGGKDKVIKAGQFKFAIKEGKGNPAKINGLPTAEVPVSADGKIALGTLNFTKAGTYTFTVSEVNAGEEGYTYDDKAVTAVVIVELNTETNKFEVKSISFQKDGKNVEGIAFVNTFTPPIIPEAPQTGDTTNVLMWLMLMTCSLGAIVALGLSRKSEAQK